MLLISLPSQHPLDRVEKPHPLYQIKTVWLVGMVRKEMKLDLVADLDWILASFTQSSEAMGNTLPNIGECNCTVILTQL